MERKVRCWYWPIDTCGKATGGGDGEEGQLCVAGQGENNGGTYRDADVHQEVRANEAIAGLSRVMVDGLLRQRDGPMDQERLAEVEGGEGDAGWHYRDHVPVLNAKAREEERRRTACLAKSW